MFMFLFCLLIKELPNFLIVLAKLLNYCIYDFFSFVILFFFNLKLLFYWHTFVNKKSCFFFVSTFTLDTFSM